MKIAVTGKGGVGKTTLAASLARCRLKAGYRVVAVDADPDANLAGTLGYRGERIAPLTGLRKLIEERVGGSQGWGGFLKMNPKVSDIPERFGVEIDGIRLLVLGSIKRGRGGCACPENVLLREVLNHLMLQDDEHVIVDMEAGLEHLGRGTAEGVDVMLVVVEPGWASLETAKRIAGLGVDLGIRRIEVVANKISSETDRAFVEENLEDPPILGFLPLDKGLEAEARTNRFDLDRSFHREVARIAERLIGKGSMS